MYDIFYTKENTRSFNAKAIHFNDNDFNMDKQMDKHTILLDSFACEYI